MKRVRVMIPFTDKATGKLRKVNEEFDVTEQRLEEIKAVSVNMVLVLGEVKEETPKRSRKK